MFSHKLMLIFFISYKNYVILSVECFKFHIVLFVIYHHLEPFILIFIILILNPISPAIQLNYV